MSQIKRTDDTTRQAAEAAEAAEDDLPLYEPVALTAVPTVRAPAVGWVPESDAWLRRAVRKRVDGDDPLSHVVAAGLCLRLAEVSDARARVDAFLRGQEPVDAHPAVQWVRSLPGEDLAYVDDLAASEAELILDDLAHLARYPRAENDDWQLMLGVVCERRDDLEGVAALLALAGSGARLVRALDLLDDEGRAAAASVPPLRLRSTQLDRARTGQPEAWWTRLTPVGE